MSSSGSQSRMNENDFEKVRRRWAIVEDGGIAEQLQADEVQHHFNANRAERRTVRTDIQVARQAHSREQLRLQTEQLRRAEARRRQEEGDLEVAEAAASSSRPAASAGGDDQRLERLELERQDELMARSLQEKEERRYERWKARQQAKELSRERRRLERAIAAGLESGGGGAEDAGDFSDLCPLPDGLEGTLRARAEAERDEELARLLQEQEAKRRGGRERREMEEKDRRLAEIIQQQQELRLSRRRRQRRREQRVSDAGTQTAGHEQPQEQRAESPIYDQLAAAWTAEDGAELSVSIPDLRPARAEAQEETATLYFDNGSPLVDNSYRGSPVTRLDDKIKAGNRLVVSRRPGTRESLIEAVTGSAELGAQLAARSPRQPARPAVEEAPVYAVSQIPRVIAVDPPPSHRAQVRQPGPFAFENSTLFRPAQPFASPEAATTPLGPTFNIAAAIDPTYRREEERRPGARPMRPKSMYELRSDGGKAEGEPIWEEGLPMPIHGERRQPSDPRINASADKKSGNCKVQ